MSKSAKDFSDGEKLKDYMYHRMVVRAFNRLPAMDMQEVPKEVYRDRLMDTGIESSSIDRMMEIEAAVQGNYGENSMFHVLELTQGDETKWVLRADTSVSGLSATYGVPVIIESGKKHNVVTTRTGITFSDKIALKDQQTHGIDAFKGATLDHKQKQAIVYATGTGKSFVLIAPTIARGKGVFVLPDDKQVDQLRGDLMFFDEEIDGLRDGVSNGIITSKAIRKGEEAVALQNYKHVLIDRHDLERFIPHLENETVSIDEVHEVSRANLDALIENGVTLQAVTATWTESLQELFGDPLTEINMNYALNELRAFRDIKTEGKQFDAGDSLDDRAFTIMADYYGGITYTSSDHMSQGHPKSKYMTLDKVRELIEEGSIEPELRSIVRMVRKSNEIRRADNMNMAFAKDEAMLKTLESAYQSVFEGEYEQLDALAEKVSEMRARSRIGEERRLTRELLGLPEKEEKINLDDPQIQALYADVIEESHITPEGLQQESESALKQEIADRITRKLVGLFRGNTPEGEVRRIEKLGHLDARLEFYSDASILKDERQQGFIDNVLQQDSTTQERIADLLEGVQNREELLDSIAKGDFTKLKINADQIDLMQFEGARYATLVEPGDAQGAAETAERIHQGYHIHTINDSELVTGFSNPDIMSVQRCVENVIDDAVIRATQMLGRVIRAKDGVAFATEYMGSQIDLSKELGERGGRTFTFDDVLAEDYMSRVKEFRANFKRTHPSVPPDRPPVTTQGGAIEKMQPQAQERSR